MAETIKLLPPQQLDRNPENPRLVFREDELQELEDSIAKQGILVPLTVFQDSRFYFILDGERRWRCALKLGLQRVPVIVQPKPSRMENIMMMFAIHNARRDWDPLPTAFKLEELETEYLARFGKKPTESELAGVASLSRGEVRRLRMLLAIPLEYREELLAELEKPHSKQVLTVDHILEATKAAISLRKQQILDDEGEESLRRAIVDKFRAGTISNTVGPRKLIRLAQAVGRDEVPTRVAKRAVDRIIKDPEYSVEDAFTETVEKVDFEHSTQQIAERLLAKLEEHLSRDYEASPQLLETLRDVKTAIARILR